MIKPQGDICIIECYYLMTHIHQTQDVTHCTLHTIEHDELQLVIV